MKIAKKNWMSVWEDSTAFPPVFPILPAAGFVFDRRNTLFHIFPKGYGRDISADI